VGPVQRSAAQDADAPWVTQNLTRDAVHRRDIAEGQAKRRAARAGILPTSPLYAVKRAAEKVDMLLTFDQQSLVQKQLDQASRRVDEAVALIAAGEETGATVSLEEYRDTLLAVANETGSSVATASLVRQQVSENAALLSAARPDDTVYAVKVALLEASTELPDSTTDVHESDVRATLISDSIDTINGAMQTGDVEKATQVYEGLKTAVADLQEDPTLEPEVRKDVLSSLKQAEESLHKEDATQVASATGSALDAPEERGGRTTIVEEKLLTPEEREGVALAAFNRVVRFDQPRPQLNQLVYEIKTIEKEYPKQARLILSQLYRMLPKNDSTTALSQALRAGIQELREEK
jgi:hypothetical protein